MLVDIFVHWRRSLQLLHPHKLRLFFLVTLKTALEAAKNLLQYFWWACSLLLLMEWVSLHFLHTHLIAFVSMGLYYVLFFATLLAVRPTIERKDEDYFSSYMLSWRFIAMSLLWLIPHISGPLVASAFYGVPLGLLLWPLIILSCFFLLDAPLRFGQVTMSLRRSARILWRCLPIFGVFALYLMSLHSISGPAQLWPLAKTMHGIDPYASTMLISLFGWFLVGLEFFVRQFLTIFFLSFCCMYYLKIKYEQYGQLYGNQVQGDS